MFDVHVLLPDVPGALARMGEAVAANGLSVEGGGVWVVNGEGHGHFLFDNGEAARDALVQAGLEVLAVHPVTTLRLKQEVPGQLGKLARRMADVGVNILVQYSDHDHQLILVTDDPQRADLVAEEWQRQRD